MLRQSLPASLLTLACVALLSAGSLSQDIVVPGGMEWSQRHTNPEPQRPTTLGLALVPSRGRAIDSRDDGAANDELADGDRRGAPSYNTPFKSITAISFPTSAQPFNDDHTHHSKPEKPEKKQQQVKQFDEESKLPFTVSLNKAGEYFYPLSAKPIDIGDGTSIGWEPEDTLLVHPISNGHSVNQFQPPTISLEDDAIQDEDARYTTLDKLFQSRIHTKLPDTRALPNSVLGGLHPDEVYYADKDLVIIKGGGFTTKYPYNAAEDYLNSIRQGVDNYDREAQIGNELGEANNIRATNVRPDEQFSRVPLVFRFINGNIPAIVRPDSSSYVHRTNSQQRIPAAKAFPPVREISFQPIIAASQKPYYFVPSSSQKVERMSLDNGDAVQFYQPTEHEDEFLAMPSETIVHKVAPPKKRSPDSNVISYHYQTRGSGNQAYSIVDYKVHKDEAAQQAAAKTQHQQNFRVPNVNPNTIQLTNNKETVQEKPRQQLLTNQERNEQHFEELEDFSAPGPVHNLVPTVQIPKQRPAINNQQTRPSPSPGQPQSSPQFISPSQHQHPHPVAAKPPQHSSPQFISTPQFPISLEGDTRVNYLQPLPPMNQQAEFINQHSQAVLLSSARPQQQQRRPDSQFSPANPIIKLHPTGILSLQGDTRVNFLPPLRNAHSQAEFTNRRPTENRMVPQSRRQNRPGAVGNTASKRGTAVPRARPASPGPNTQQQQGQRRRYMEPVRRIPIIPRQPPKI